MNHNQSLSILLWISKSRINSQGLAPIWARMTISGRRAELATGQHVAPKHWNSENGEVLKTAKDFASANNQLTMFKADILREYNKLIATKENVTAEDLKSALKGPDQNGKTLMDLFAQFIRMQAERSEVGELSSGRIVRFPILKDKCSAFLKARYKRSDILLTDLKLSFAVELEHFMRTVQRIGHNTTTKHIKDLKQVLHYAHMVGITDTNPFQHFKCKYRKVNRDVLDQDELKILEKKKFEIKRLEEVRDCYLFSCYTGYAYSDAAALTPDDVTNGIDGNKWIIRIRKKTNTPENVPLLPVPLAIIAKYAKHPYCSKFRKLLPMNSNQRYNSYLKEVADLCGIKKDLTTHTARHTFATTLLLSNDVPIETVMQLLGHNDMRTTQIYGKIVPVKISKDILKLKMKLK